MATYYFRNAGTDWNTASNWSLSDGGPADGAVPTAADAAYFTGNSGNCTVSTASRTCLSLIFSSVLEEFEYTGTFTLNNTLTVSGNITLSPTMTFAGTSTITINANSTITSNTKVFPCSITISGPRTITLGDDIYVDLDFNTSVPGGGSLTLNGNTLYVSRNFQSITVGTSVICNSNLTMIGTGVFSVVPSFSATLSGTGTISFNTSGTITINSTFVTSNQGSRTIQYVNGTVVVPPGNGLGLVAANSTTLSVNLKGIRIKGGATIATQGAISLLSDLVIDGGTVFFGAGFLPANQPLTINNNGGNLYFGETELPSLISGNPFGSLTGGNATWYFRGSGNCVFVGHNLGYVYPSMVFDHTGTITFRNGNYIGNETFALIFGGGLTYTYIRGKFATEGFTGIKNRGLINIGNVCTLIGFDKANGLNNIVITNGITVTMDKFFSGRPDLITNVFCSTTTGAYTINFQDTFEKFANWVKVSNCTVARRGQLIILNQKATTVTGRNVGVRYQNVWPNGVPKDSPVTSDNSTAFGAGGLLADPAIAL